MMDDPPIGQPTLAAVLTQTYGSAVDRVDHDLAAALYALPFVSDVYRLTPSATRYRAFDDVHQFRWVVVLNPYSARHVYAASRTAESVLGRERMVWITFVDGDAGESPLVGRGQRIAMDPAHRAPSGATAIPLSDDERRARAGNVRVLVVSDDYAFVDGVIAVVGTRAVQHSWSRYAVPLLESRDFDRVVIDGAVVGMHAASLCEWIDAHRRDVVPRARVVLHGAPDTVRSRVAKTSIAICASIDDFEIRAWLSE